MELPKISCTFYQVMGLDKERPLQTSFLARFQCHRMAMCFLEVTSQNLEVNYMEKVSTHGTSKLVSSLCRRVCYVTSASVFFSQVRVANDIAPSGRALETLCPAPLRSLPPTFPRTLMPNSRSRSPCLPSSRRNGALPQHEECRIFLPLQFQE